ncbi:OmpA family protein [Cellvibrio sp. UBA7661]|uniref:OmpA family protein n=1 Tax=Cellvibrio sp. UBA7661 TaxID=1946311 RepID=UPI002F35E993
MLRRVLSFGVVFLALIGVSALVGQSAYADWEEDHPLFSAYPNADLEQAQMYDYEKFSLPASVVDTSQNDPQFTQVDAIGDVYWHNYDLENVSSLKVYENYLAAAKQLGFKELFSCALDACGDEKQARELGSLVAVRGDVYNHYRNPYYWLGEKDTPKGKILAAWFVGAYEDSVSLQQVIVETEPLQTGLVKVDEAYANKPATTAEVAPLSEEEKAKDHSMLPRYPGAKLRNHNKVDTETVTIPVANNAADKTPLKLTGDLARHGYTMQNVSTLKVYENYKAALTTAGFSFISQCELEQCGTEKQASDLGGKVSMEESVYNWYRKPYYLLAKKSLPTGNVYAAIFIGGYEDEVGLQQIILEEKAVQTGLVSVNADELKQQIDAEGKALIYGIYFDTGKAEIKTESKPTLDAIAELLKRNPDLLLYVVGHTDDTGDGAANVTLSRQRADAVVAALIKEYQVAANRLQAQGVGPYAPAGNNTSEAGKQKNRRVELVKRLR